MQRTYFWGLVSIDSLNVKALLGAFNQEKALEGALSVITDLRLKLQCVLCANYAQSPWSLLLIYGHQGEYNFTPNLIPAAGYNADLLQPTRSMKEHLQQ